MQTLNVEYNGVFEKWFSIVENIVLGEQQFNDEQKKFIYFLDSAVIEAGPGSGKTTALAAKVALLFKEIEEKGSREGICVITHTNAAVQEILMVLKELGYEEISHPHFIGTIHSFFNKYIVPKAYQSEVSNQPLKFTEESLDWHYRKSIKMKHHWLKNEALDSVVRRIMRVDYEVELFPFKVRTINVQGWDKFDKYEEAFNFAMEERFKQGFLLYDDTLKIAIQLLRKSKSIEELLQNRFKYILIDEYQDTAEMVLRPMVDIFKKSESSIQLIGDSNQHIYYGLNPINQTGLPRYSLNITNRFGENIARPLNRMFQSRIQPKNLGKSKSPILYVYKEPSIISEGFSKILIQLKLQTESKQSRILIAERNQINQLGEKLKLNLKNKKKNNLQASRELINRLLAKEINETIFSTRTLLNQQYLEEGLCINKCVLDFLRSSTDEVEHLKSAINNFLAPFNKSIKVCNRLFTEIKRIKNNRDSEIETKNDLIPVQTIHSTKGQTLSTNMVYLSKESVEELGFLESYGVPTINHVEYQEIDKRVVYVAMSRSTTLLVVALHADTYSNLSDEIKNELKKDFLVVEEDEL